MDFLVAEKGRGSDAPIEIKGLGIKAQPLRMLGFLSIDTITIEYDGLRLRLPQPLRYGLHKLMISERRSKAEKADKDRRLAIDVLRMLVSKGEYESIKDMFTSLPKNWRKWIINALGKGDASDLLEMLSDKSKGNPSR